MRIATLLMEPIFEYKYDEFGDIINIGKVIEEIEPELDYDFYNDEVIEMEKSINPILVVPQEGVRYSIINIIAYCLTHIVNDYMNRYADQNNSNINNPSKCRLYLKNEFLFKTALLTWVKKHYATIQELQEGHDAGNKLDVKGLDINKTTLNPTVQDEMKKILFEDILDCQEIDQVKILKHLAILEKKIYKSLQEGKKDFYKPATVKPMNKYDNPMGIQGIKASVVWNNIKDPDLIGVNLEERNNIDIIKTEMNLSTVEKIKKDYPEAYDRIVKLLNSGIIKGSIDSVAIPKNVETPKWLIEFIDFRTIANDNMSAFPFESTGLNRMNAVKNNNVNYTNILSL